MHPSTPQYRSTDRPAVPSAADVPRVAVVRPLGPISIDGGSDLAVRKQIREALVSGADTVRLDLSAVSMIDSAGMGELVAAHCGARNYGSRLELCNIPPRVHGTLKLMELLKVFDIADERPPSFFESSTAGQLELRH